MRSCCAHFLIRWRGRSAGGHARAPERAGHLILRMLAVLLFVQTILHADESSSHFLWEQANARMANAHTPEDFLETARTYNRLASGGVRNGPLFYNLGTALLLAGDGENAAAAFRRAERYLGSTPELRVNLRQALARQLGQPDADLPWDHIVFFWHYDEPLRVRALAALCGWLLLWLALLLRLLTRPPAESAVSWDARPPFLEKAPLVELKGGRPREPPHHAVLSDRMRSLANACLFFGMLLCLVFTVSTAFSWVQEQMDDRTWSERVFASKTVSEQKP